MDARSPTSGRPLLVFLNEVAGGRKLLQAVRERQEQVSSVVVAAPQNQPSVGQLIDSGELREAARARVEVTMAVLAEFGIDSVGEVMDPEPVAGARRRRPRPRARRGAALLPLRHPLRLHPQGPGRVGPGAGRTGDEADPHPGPDRRRRDPLGPDPHPRRRDQDRRRPGPRQPAQGARRRPARTATRSSARGPRTSARPRSSATSPRPWPSSTAPTSTRPGSR